MADPQEIVDKEAQEENKADAAIIPNAAKAGWNAIKGGARMAADALTSGAKRVGQDLGITKDENQYEDKARMDSIRKAVNGKKKGGTVKKMRSGGSTSSASKRADGIAVKGKTRGKIC